MATKCVLVDVTQALEILQLPEGFRLKDWTEAKPEEYWIVSRKEGGFRSEKYMETQLIGIERIADGKTATFEVCGLSFRNGEKVADTKLVQLFDFAHHVDCALASLQGDTYGN